MLVPFDIVKGKNRPVPRGQLGNGLIKGDAVNYRHCIGVLGAFHYLNRRFTILSRLLHTNSAFAEVHENLIDCQSVKPGSESRFASKTANFSKELYEDLLSEILSFGHISSHP